MAKGNHLIEFKPVYLKPKMAAANGIEDFANELSTHCPFCQIDSTPSEIKSYHTPLISIQKMQSANGTACYPHSSS